ncbi:MAG: hypothetical protein HKP46_19975 [Myxococcales bacterium]|nr:hypothetical protein [Myxococcales bacterium]
MYSGVCQLLVKLHDAARSRIPGHGGGGGGGVFVFFVFFVFFEEESA